MRAAVTVGLISWAIIAAPASMAFAGDGGQEQEATAEETDEALQPGAEAAQDRGSKPHSCEAEEQRAEQLAEEAKYTKYDEDTQEKIRTAFQAWYTCAGVPYIARLPWERIVGSTLICFYDAKAARARAGIREERKASKIGGVVSLSELYRLQTVAKKSDKFGARVRQQMKKDKLTTLPCSAEHVRYIARCMKERDEHGLTECEGPEWSRFMASITD